MMLLSSTEVERNTRTLMASPECQQMTCPVTVTMLVVMSVDYLVGAVVTVDGCMLNGNASRRMLMM